MIMHNSTYITDIHCNCRFLVMPQNEPWVTRAKFGMVYTYFTGLFKS